MQPINISADIFSGTIATVALVLALINTYFLFLKKGQLQVSQPLQFYVGADGGSDIPKVVVALLLYWTTPRGGVVANMYALLKRGDGQQVFPIWLFGRRSELNRATGIKLNDQGLGVAHTFLLADEAASGGYNFLPGEYELELHAAVSSEPFSKIFSVQFELNKENVSHMKSGEGFYFDWNPVLKKYIKKKSSHAKKSPLEVGTVI